MSSRWPAVLESLFCYLQALYQGYVTLLLHVCVYPSENRNNDGTPVLG